MPDIDRSDGPEDVDIDLSQAEEGNHSSMQVVANNISGNNGGAGNLNIMVIEPNIVDREPDSMIEMACLCGTKAHHMLTVPWNTAKNNPNGCCCFIPRGIFGYPCRCANERDKVAAICQCDLSLGFSKVDRHLRNCLCYPYISFTKWTMSSETSHLCRSCWGSLIVLWILFLILVFLFDIVYLTIAIVSMGILLALLTWMVLMIGLVCLPCILVYYSCEDIS